MKFTLAIISYNAEKTITKCLESCVKQTYSDIDIIVVDDNSTDSTVKIVREHVNKDSRIRLVTHSINRSALQARKTAIENARYEYVWFIDSDDYIENMHSVEILCRFLKEKNCPDMVTFGSNDYDHNGNFKRQFYDWGRHRGLKQWKFDSDFRPYTRITKKSVLLKAARLIRSDLYLYRHNDFFMFNLVKFYVDSKETLEEPLYSYTLSSNSVTNQKDIKSISKHIDLISLLLKEYEKAASQIDQDDVEIDSFVIKERNKLFNYAIGQYKDDPDMYLHVLREIYDYKKEIIISLTTYSKRIETVHLAIKSLLSQTISVDRVILWLDENEFLFSDLPVELKSLVSKKFSIMFCPNYKSYKKLIPALEFYPKATIITFDDDIDYPEDQVEKLLLVHFENSRNVVCNVARNINVKNGKLQPYSDWTHVSDEQIGKPLLNLLPIGVGGVLYPASSLNREVFNVDNFMKLSPHGDDLWFKSMSLLNGTNVVCTSSGYSLFKNQIEGTAEIGLWQQINNGNDSNREQLLKIVENYDQLKYLLFSSRFADCISTFKGPPTKHDVICRRKKGSNEEPYLCSCSYSPFELSNYLFREKRYYESGSIYKYLADETSGFPYYKINLHKAIECLKLAGKRGSLLPRSNSHISKSQYDLAVLDIIVNYDVNCPSEYINAQLKKIKNIRDVNLFLAKYEVRNIDNWLSRVNAWLASYSLNTIALSNEKFSHILGALTQESKKNISGPLITVFMSAFNSEDTVEFSVMSILNQSYKNFEFIIVDDCSTDNTRYILEGLASVDKRVRLICNEINRGTYYNRNYGLKVARGKYFTIMDADDYALQDGVESMVNSLNANNGLVAVWGSWVRLRHDGRFLCSYTWTSSYMTPAVATLMFERNTVLGSIGYYDCVRFGADSEYLERIKVTFGSDRVRHFDLPLRLATSSKKSLTGKADTGIDHIMGTSKIRLEYKASWTKWHKQSDKLYIPYNFTAERKFFAPSKMLPF